ncbi:MAG: hypothetical protein Ct9H300mP25_17060 [Acidobacteriota bacterium]|nr:MAG: hypothetical protein Ct9H300mP25_17060 [Acidobacteriota bacterium]
MFVVDNADHLGEIQAWNLATGEQVWTHEFSESQNWGPILTTAGGLVFAGGTNDRYFRAFNAETGEVLWEQRRILVLLAYRRHMQSTECSTLLSSQAGALMRRVCNAQLMSISIVRKWCRKGALFGCLPSANEGSVDHVESEIEYNSDLFSL